MIHKALDPDERRRLVRRLQRLASHRAALEGRMRFGEWAGGEQPTDGTIHMPWYRFSPEADSFMNDVRAAGWIVPIDGPGWLSTPRGRRLMTDSDAVAMASPDELGQLITALVRQERLGDGTVGAARQSGLLAAIARRAEVLAVELDTDETIGTWEQRPWGSPRAADQLVAEAAGEIVEIGLARGGCYGPCPVYSVALRRDGNAAFVGEYFVTLAGEHTAPFDPDQFEILALAVAYLRFGNLRRHYAVDHTDAPTISTWVIRSERRRTVEDYGGAGPQRLRQIEGLIDDAAAEVPWRLLTDLRPKGADPSFDPAADDSRQPNLEPGGRPHWTQAPPRSKAHGRGSGTAP